MTKKEFYKDLEHIAESGSNEIRIFNLAERYAQSELSEANKDIEGLHKEVLAYREKVSEQLKEIERLKAALHKIDDIRNSIIGYQQINWSAHIYPLVAALKEAGFEGLGYDKAKEMAMTQLDRIQSQGEEIERLKEGLRTAVRHIEIFDHKNSPIVLAKLDSLITPK